MRQNIGLFFFFGLVASLIDRAWVGLGTLVYRGAAPQPWWVPIQYGVMGVVAVYFAALVTRYLVRRDMPPPRDPIAAFAVSGAWFIVAQLGGGIIDAYFPLSFALALLAIWLIRFLLHHRQERLAIFAISLALGIAGTLGELLLVRLGIMRYPRAAAWGLPWWVPGLWITAAYFARDIARTWFGGR